MVQPIIPHKLFPLAVVLLSVVPLASKRTPSSPVTSSSAVPSRSDLVLKAKHQPIQLFPEVSGGDASGPLHSVGRLEAQDDNGLVQKVTGILQLLQKVPVVDDVGLVVTSSQVENDPVHLRQEHASHSKVTCVFQGNE